MKTSPNTPNTQNPHNLPKRLFHCLLFVLLWLLMACIAAAILSSCGTHRKVITTAVADTVYIERTLQHDTVLVEKTITVHDTLWQQQTQHNESHIVIDYDPATGNKVREEQTHSEDYISLQIQNLHLMYTADSLRAVLRDQTAKSESHKADTIQQSENGDAARTTAQTFWRALSSNYLFWLLLISILVYLASSHKTH